MIVKVRIRNSNNVTDAFICQKGLKQWEITSPLLLLLFINELARDIIKNGSHGIQLLPDTTELFISLFCRRHCSFARYHSWVANPFKRSCSKLCHTRSPC